MRRSGISERRGFAASAAAVTVAMVLALVAIGYGYAANSAATGELSSLSASYTSEYALVASLSASVSSLNGSLDARVGSLGASVASQSSRISSMNGTVSSQADEIGTLRSEVGSLETSLTSLQAGIQSLNSTIQTLRSEISTPTPSGPGLVQQAEATCPYPCSDQFANASFPFPAHQGDMLVVTLVADDVAALTVLDSVGTNLSLAARATSSTCDSNSGACQAEIYWGTLPVSASDSVIVREIDLNVALRVQVWEFSGVTSVGNIETCSPTCGSVSYPTGSILVATARDVNGSGPGFTWYPYANSGVASSEYLVATASGSTTFPFSTAVNDVEAAAVLV